MAANGDLENARLDHQVCRPAHGTTPRREAWAMVP